MAERRSMLERGGHLAKNLLLIAAAAAVLLYLLVHLRVVVLPVVGALIAVSVLETPVSWLRDRGWPSLLATWTVLLVAGSIAALVVAVLVPQVTNELDELGSNVKEGSDQALRWLAESPLDLTEEDIDRYIEQASSKLRENQDRIIGGAVSGATLVLELITGFVLMVVLTFFFLKDGPKMTGWALGHLRRADHRADATEVGRRTWRSVKAYMRGVATIAFIDAILIGIALLVIGVPLVVPLMFITFLGGFFPLVGAVAAGAVAALVALVTNGVLDALLVAAAVTVIQQVEGDVLQPVVMGRAVNLHPVVILLSLTAGAVVAGIVGAFLAVPTTVVAVTAGHYLRYERKTDPAPATG